MNPQIPTAPETEALKTVKVNSFTVVPTTVAPYGTVTATWDVTIPQTDFEITLALHNQPVSSTGTKTFKLATQREAFALTAVITEPQFASRILKAIQVQVNSGDARTRIFLHQW